MVIDLMMLILMVIAAAGWIASIVLFFIGTCGTTLELFRYHRDALDYDRRRHGLCVQCGYDLRGSTQRCPECGRPFQTPFTPQIVSR